MMCLIVTSIFFSQVLMSQFVSSIWTIISRSLEEWGQRCLYSFFTWFHFPAPQELLKPVLFPHPSPARSWALWGCLDSGQKAAPSLVRSSILSTEWGVSAVALYCSKILLHSWFSLNYYDGTKLWGPFRGSSLLSIFPSLVILFLLFVDSLFSHYIYFFSTIILCFCCCMDESQSVCWQM